MKIMSGQTPPLTGQSAIDTCVQTWQRVQCGCLPIPGQPPGSDFHGERTKNQLHVSFTTIYCSCQEAYFVENTTWARIFAHVDMEDEQPPLAMWPTICQSRRHANEIPPITWRTDWPPRCYEKADRLVSSINIERGRRIFAHVVG